MKIINPTSNNMSTFSLVLRWAQSVFKALVGGLSFGQPTGQASTGVYNAFQVDNFNNIILYIGAVGSGATLAWTASNTGQAFNHGLQRQPMGFLVIYKSKTCDVYSTATPTANNITLAVTDDTATTIVMVF